MICLDSNFRSSLCFSFPILPSHKSARLLASSWPFFGLLGVFGGSGVGAGNWAGLVEVRGGKRTVGRGEGSGVAVGEMGLEKG